MGNCAGVFGVCLVPNFVAGVMFTLYCLPSLAVTVQVEPFSAVTLPVIQWWRPGLAGAVVVGAVVAVGVVLGLPDPPEHPGEADRHYRAEKPDGCLRRCPSMTPA